MASPYDILIEIQAKAQEVAQATAAIQGMVDKATASGPALASGLKQGQQAAQALSQSATDAGTALASGMAQGAKAASSTSAAVNEVSQATAKMKGLAEEAETAWSRFGGSTKEALTFGFGTELAQKAIDLLLEIPKLFVESMEKGVEFNKEMETLSIGLAGALRQAQPEKYLSFDRARSAATTAITAIQQKANALGLDFKSVGEAVQTSMLPLVEGGIKNINQQIEVMTLLMQASAAKGVTGFQAQRDAMDILAGRAERVMLGRELGITNEDIKRAQEAGTLYDYLTQKLAAYQEAGVAASQTFAGLWQSVQNLVTQLEGQASGSIFDDLKSTLADIKTELDSIEAKGFATGLSVQIGGVVDGLKKVYNFLRSIGEATSFLNKLTAEYWLLGNGAGAQESGRLAAQYTANQQIVESLREQIAEAKNAEQTDQARRAVVMAIGQAHEQVANAQGEEKTAAETLLTALQAIEASIGRSTTGHHEAATAASGVTHALADSNGELDKMLQKLPALIDGLNKMAQAAGLAERLANAKGPYEKQSVHEDQKSQLMQQANGLAIQAGGNGDLSSTEAAQAELTRISQQGLATTQEQVAAATQLAQVIKEMIPQDQGIAAAKREQLELTKKLGDEEDKRAGQHNLTTATSKADLTAKEDELKLTEQIRHYKDEGYDDARAHAMAQQDIEDARKKIDLEKQFASEKKASASAGRQEARDARMEDAAADRDRKNSLQEIKNQLADIKGDPFLTDAEKIPQELRLLEQEREQLLANIKARQDYIAAHQGDPTSAVKSSAMQGENVQDQRSLAQNQQQMALLGGGGQIKSQLVQLQNQWALTSQNIGKSIAQNIQTAVDGVSNAIDGLIEGTHNWRQAFAQAGSSIIKSLIQLGVQMVVSAVLGKTLSKSAASAQATDSATITAAAAPAAAATSVSSYGVAAIVGAALAIAAIAAIIAMATSHAEGGMIPGRPSHRDNRLAHVASGEYVVRTSAVQHYGPDFFHQLNNMSLPRTAFASGGLVGDRDGYTPIMASVVGGSPNVNVAGSRLTLIQPRSQSEFLQALQSSEGKKIILGHVKSNRTEVGIRS